MATVTETTALSPDATHSSITAQSILSTAAPTTTPSFSFTPFLQNTVGHHLISTTPVCPDFEAGNCPLGRRCPNRHPTPTVSSSGWHPRKTNDQFVCKHWLKGLCKKADSCDFLHEYNLKKMSECQFYNQNGFCQNGDECLYLHVKEESRLPLCEDYEKGFCERGPRCGKRHVRRKLCEFYMAGFCPDGPECKRGVHLKAPGPSAVDKAKSDGEKDKKDLDGDSRMEEGERDDRRGGGGAGEWKGKSGRYTGRGRWRNKR